MNRNPDIDATLRKAKRQRADYIGAKLHASVLPLALVTLLSFALVQFAVGTSEEPAESSSGASVPHVSSSAVIEKRPVPSFSVAAPQDREKRPCLALAQLLQ